MPRILCIAALLAAFALCAVNAATAEDVLGSVRDDNASAALERRVMAEISFDLALNQEADGGYTASHAIAEYLGDEGLLWLRYFHSLASGAPGNAPMRVAMMEFKNRTAWGAFEQRHLGTSQVLYDIFWINWRRVLWRTTDESTEFAPLSKERDTEAVAGFVWAFRYSPKEGKETAVTDVLRKHAKGIKEKAEQTNDFLEKRTWASGAFQSQYRFLETWEFTNMNALTEFTDDGTVYAKMLDELLPLLSDFATAIYIPGNQNGRILAARGAVLMSEAGKKAQADPNTVSQEEEKDEDDNRQ